MIALLDINVAADIIRNVDGTWCEVRTGSPPQSGFAACGFFAAEPVSAVNLREQLEQTRRVDGGGGEEALDMLERLFALEPSAEVLDEYVSRMKLVYGYDLHWAMSHEPDPRPEMARRGESYRLMRRRLTRDALPDLAAEFASAGGEWYRLSRSGLGDFREGVQPSTPSLLREDGNIVAFGGGKPQSRAARDDGVAYSLAIDRMTNFPVLVGIAGARGVRATAIGMPTADLSPAEAGGVTATIVDTSLPAYAITPDGLVGGRIVRVADFGGVCNYPASGVDVVLEQPADEILAVFATTQTFEKANAKVERQERDYVQEAGARAHETTFNIDLDGDDIADLRGGVAGYSTQASEYSESWVEANIGGSWKLVFVASVSDCA